MARKSTTCMTFYIQKKKSGKLPERTEGRLGADVVGSRDLCSVTRGDDDTTELISTNTILNLATEVHRLLVPAPLLEELKQRAHSSENLGAPWA